MEFTPEQRKLIEAAKAAGHRRVMLEYTPEQLADWEEARDRALAEKPQVIADFHKRRKAEAEETFSGHLRRAINASLRYPTSLAEEVGIDWRLLEDFRCGDATLPSNVIDRLVAVLGLRLMQEIPVPSDQRKRDCPTGTAKEPRREEVVDTIV